MTRDELSILEVGSTVIVQNPDQRISPMRGNYRGSARHMQEAIVYDRISGAQIQVPVAWVSSVKEGDPV